MSVRSLVALAVLAVAVPAQAAHRHDADIEKDVHRTILRYVHYGVFDSVGVAVQDGHVLLRGSVQRGYRKNDIEKRVADVPGVVGVRNEIKVQSASLYDDQLRHQIYRSIYGFDGVLPHVGVDPQVRIVVDRGRVTLTGYVLSRVDQVKIGMLARSTSAFAVDNQVKLESERHSEPVKPGAELTI